MDISPRVSMICKDLISSFGKEHKGENPIRSLFDSLDVSQDGFIDMSELRSAFKDTNITDAEFKKLWNNFMECDFNGNQTRNV